MDGYSNKRGGGGGLMAPRKGYNFKDAASERDQNVQYCNRIGCSGRIKYSQNTRIGSLEKTKISKPTFRPSNGSEITGSSSGSSSSATSARKSCLDSKRKLPLNLSESSVSENASSSSSSPTKYQSEIMRKSGKAEIGTSSLSSNNKTPKSSYQNSKSRDQNISSVPSISRSSALRPINTTSNRNRYGLRNLKCNSISDVVPPSCSSSDSTKNRSAVGESSQGRKLTAASSVDGQLCPSGVSVSDSRHGSREDASVRNRRAVNVNSRIRVSSSYRQNGRSISSSLREPPALRIPDSDLPSRGRNLNVFSSGSSSYSLSSSSNDENGSGTNADLGFTHFMNRDSLRRYNMDGIAEVLLALERIEQDEELTHEQVLALETSIFLGGLNLYDQHRDMRLDIDNMSYEELLALEERMGTVSTALPEEALSKCIKKSIYQSTPSKVLATGSAEEEDDIKCSVCQEEYMIGDEIGNLVECQHGYHAKCINQWLRMKNWCPICKAAAAPSQTSSLSSS